MDIDFSFTQIDATSDRYGDESPPIRLYDAYVADVELRFDGARERLPRVPMLYFLTSLHRLVIESYLSGKPAVDDLWDTGHRYSLTISDDRVVLALPLGSSTPLVLGANDFLVALKRATFKLLWVMHDESPSPLGEEGVFAQNSPMSIAASLVLRGKVPRE